MYSITDVSDPNPEVLGDLTTNNQTITVAQGTGLLVPMILITSRYRHLGTYSSIRTARYRTWIQIYEYIHFRICVCDKKLPVVAPSVRDPDPHLDPLVTSTDPDPATEPSLFS